MWSVPPGPQVVEGAGGEGHCRGGLPQHISRRWLARRLSKVPDGGFVNAHCIYTPELADLFRQEGMKTVCILRDPRDVAVSQMHYIKQLENHIAHQGYIALPSDHERLLVSIRGGELGGRKLQSLYERYRQFLRWERDGGAAVVKFEDLVGTKRRGSTEAQRLAVEGVASHLGVVEEDLFGVGWTFRKGRSGAGGRSFRRSTSGR